MRHKPSIDILIPDTYSSDDDVSAVIMAHMLAGHRSILPPGTWTVAPTVLALPSNTELHLSPGSIIKCAPTTETVHQVVRFANVTNAHISGHGKIDGGRDTYTGATSEYGHCIASLGSLDCSVMGVKAVNAVGDGLYVSNGASSVATRNMVVADFEAHNNGRQGISIVSSDGFRGSNILLTTSSNTSPESGLDIEPNTGLFVNDTTIRGLVVKDNEGPGLLIVTTTGTVENCDIDVHSTNNATAGIRTVGAMDMTVRITGQSVGNAQDGISVDGGSPLLQNLYVAGNNTGESDTYCGARFFGTATGGMLAHSVFEPQAYGRQIWVQSLRTGFTRTFNTISGVESSGGTQGVTDVGTSSVVYDFFDGALVTS